MIDPTHWLWRLTAQQWLAAARADLQGARDHLGTRRTAVVYCRRAGGMALNAVLVHWAATGGDEEAATTRWGRSYVDHLASVAAGDRLVLKEEAVALATAVLATPTTLAEPTTISRGPNAAMRALVDQTHALVELCAEAIGAAV